ncbi:MAG: isocitrate/isopropylmalate dehydrogenase family protein [Myxococcota bacterium]
MAQYKVVILPGDGIGPETMREALKVLDVVEKHSDLSFARVEAAFGAQAYFDHGHPFPDQTQALCASADAVLKGPVGLAHEEAIRIPVELQPERGGVVPLRGLLKTFANLRPVSLPPELAHVSPLKERVTEKGLDLVMVRELLGGLYTGSKHRGEDAEGRRYVEEMLRYDEDQIRNVVRFAFELAERRDGALHNIHKRNILESSVLWNEVVEEVATEFSGVSVEHMLVDAAATHLCLDPCQFDVMVMENLFGDILSDQGGGILGSLGLMPSACIGPESAYYEPAHGSAPTIAGQGIANPYSMIGCIGLMLEYSFGQKAWGDRVFEAMREVFRSGVATSDLAENTDALRSVGTSGFGDLVVEQLEKGGAA